MEMPRDENFERDSIRMSDQYAHILCELKIERRWVKCKLLDESASGFAIALQGFLHFEDGQVLSLRRDDITYSVRVANIQTIEKGSEMATRLGVQVIEAGQKANAMTNPFVGILKGNNDKVPNGPLAGIFSVLLGIFFIGAMGTTVVLFLGSPELSTSFSDWFRTTVQRPESPGLEPDATSDSSTSTQVAHQMTAPSSAAVHTYRQSPGFSAFHGTTVRNYLAISEKQQRGIEGIQKKVAEGITQLQRTVSRKTKLSRKTKMLEQAAEAEILKILTPVQKGQWQRLKHEARNPASS